MADHFYSIATEGVAGTRDPAQITVGTTSTGANPIELRITDGALTAKEAYEFVEWLADLLVVRDKQVIAAATLK